MFALYLAGTTYTIGSGSDVVDALTKALRLLLIPAMLPLLREPEWRERGLAAFLGSMLVTLVLSYLLWLGALPVNPWLKGTALDPVAFKAHITHNVFMAFAAYLFALAAWTRKRAAEGSALVALCAAAVVNVLVMVPGRTGHIVLLALFTYFLCLRLRAKGFALAVVALGVLAVVVFLSPDTMLHRRFTLADEEYQQWRAGVPARPTSSSVSAWDAAQYAGDDSRQSGVRCRHRWLRRGLCGARGRMADAPTENPHNEILLVIAQFGIAGPRAAVAFSRRNGGWLPRLPGRFERWWRVRLVLTMAVASVLVVDAGGSLRRVLLRLHERASLRGLRGRRQRRIAPGGARGEFARGWPCAGQRGGACERAGGRDPADGRRAARVAVDPVDQGGVARGRHRRAGVRRHRRACWPRTRICGASSPSPSGRAFSAHVALVAACGAALRHRAFCIAGDRPTAYAASPAAGGPESSRPRQGLDAGNAGCSRGRSPFDDVDTHTVAMNLALAEVLGIPPRHEVVAQLERRGCGNGAALLTGGVRAPAYAVLHPHPKFRYKMWHAEGWVGVADWLARRGLETVLTGGNDSGRERISRPSWRRGCRAERSIWPES